MAPSWRNYFGYNGTATVTPSNLKSKYKKLALQKHPNKGGNTANFQKLQKMYENALANLNTKPNAKKNTAAAKKPPKKKTAAQNAKAYYNQFYQPTQRTEFKWTKAPPRGSVKQRGPSRVSEWYWQATQRRRAFIDDMLRRLQRK